MKKRETRRPASNARPTDGYVAESLLAAADGLRARLEEALQRLELSVAKADLLRQLAKSREPVTLSALAAEQQCAPSNITQLVDRLEADGLVRRIGEPKDRRTKRAELTPLGKAREAAAARETARVRREFLRSLSDTDRRALARGLAGLR